MMTLRRFVKQFPCLAVAGALMSVAQLPALAQDAHSHTQAAQSVELTADQASRAKTLLKRVRDATERFQNVEVAEADGYQLLFGCVSGDSTGAMGLHYVNMDLVNKGDSLPTIRHNVPIRPARCENWSHVYDSQWSHLTIGSKFTNNGCAIGQEGLGATFWSGANDAKSHSK